MSTNDLVRILREDFGGSQYPAWFTCYEHPLTDTVVILPGEGAYLGNTGLVIKYNNEIYSFWFSPNGITNPGIATEAGLTKLNLYLFVCGIYTALNNIDLDFLSRINEINGETNPAMGEIRRKLFSDIDPNIFTTSPHNNDISYYYTLNFHMLAGYYKDNGLAGSRIDAVFTRFNRMMPKMNIRVVNPLLRATEFTDGRIVYEV